MKNKIEEKKEEENKVVDIPLSKIKFSRWGTGIRDPEKFERLKENLKEHGQNTPIGVRPDGEMFDPWKGDHTARAAKELGWQTIKGIIHTNMTDEEAFERCISDNTTRSDYSSIELEEKISELWNTKRYKSYTELGRKIGFTGEYVSQVIRAHELREFSKEKSKVPLDKITTTDIVNTFPLSGDAQKIALLELVQKGKYKAGEVKDIVKLLNSLDIATSHSILSGEISYHQIKSEMKTQIDKKITIPTDKKLNIKIPTPIPLKGAYNTLKEAKDYIDALEDGEDKTTAINYTKFLAGALIDGLAQNGLLDLNVARRFIKDQLQIDETLLYRFDGELTQGIMFDEFDDFDECSTSDDEDEFD